MYEFNRNRALLLQKRRQKKVISWEIWKNMLNH